MTKEELAKKKGIKTKESVQTAAESLITTKAAAEEESKAEQKNTEEKHTPTPIVPKKETANENAVNSSKESPRVGRPKGKPSTKISLNIPNEYLDIIYIAAGMNYKGNTSSYIVSLIEKDIKTNGKMYRQIKALKEEC